MAAKLLSARGYAMLAGGFALFLIYGSLIPFHTRSRDLGDVVSSFQWAMANRLFPESRSDFAANCLLSMPLAFCLMGAAGVDRRANGSRVLMAVAAVAGCFLLAMAVEFAQLFFPSRTCSGSDVLAQGIGAWAGVAAWLLAGQWLTDRVREAWDHPRTGGRNGQLMLAYIGLMLFVQMLPLDLNPSPRDLYHRFADGDVKLIPFQHTSWENVQNWVELTGLYLPAGLLASQLPGRNWKHWSSWPVVIVAALGLGLSLEASQLIVSRSPSGSDALIGAAAAFVGWVIGQGFANTSERGISPKAVWLLGSAWVFILAIGAWVPFAFVSALDWSAVSWVPFADLLGGNYLRGLDDLVGLMVAYVPLGVLAAVAGRPGGTTRPLLAAAVAATIAAGLEAGQMLLPERSPSATPAVLAAAGAWVAAAVAGRLRTFAEEPVA